MPNFKAAFKTLFAKPQPIPASAIKHGGHLTDQEKNILKNLGVYVNNLSSLIQWANVINSDRVSLSRECERSCVHPMMSQALKLYTSFATNYDRTNNATIWITSDNAKYQHIGEEFLDEIGIEGRITSWAYEIAQFGNMFLEPKGIPGAGIASIDDSENQINVSRVDSDGVLLGFYRTPIGNVGQSQKLLPPWQYVHYSMNQTKTRKPIYGEQQSTEFRSISLLSPDIRRLSSKYGTGVLNDAIPTYKRMRLTEDSIMLAALSKRILRNVIKVGVDGNNIEGIKEVLDQYSTVLKRGKAIDPDSGKMTDNLDYTDVVTDIILPVWNGVNNLELMKLGGEMEVKWIADLDDQRAMLATSLDVPLNMFGGYTQETPSGLNTSAAETISITFARKARALQRALVEGTRRLFQIHLAYLGLDPDAKLFDVKMSDTSTAEESERVKALKDTVDSMNGLVDFMTSVLGERIDRVYLMQFLNDKFLRLNDLDMNKLLKGQDPNNFVVVTKESKINTVDKFLKENIKGIKEEERQKINEFVENNFNSKINSNKTKTHSLDVRAALPLSKLDCSKRGILNEAQWKDKYGAAKVKEVKEK